MFRAAGLDNSLDNWFLPVAACQQHRISEVFSVTLFQSLFPGLKIFLG